jgi:hypothetical protein
MSPQRLVGVAAVGEHPVTGLLPLRYPLALDHGCSDALEFMCKSIVQGKPLHSPTAAGWSAASCESPGIAPPGIKLSPAAAGL